MSELFAVDEPYARGALKVSDGHTIAWSIAGNPRGKAAVVLHGGPAQGSSPNMRRALDPKKYRVVLFDQRGCGDSTPHAVTTQSQDANTTWHLVDDMEALREHLAIDRWLVSGGSWGVTLALAYAQKHVERVTEMVLTSVTTSRRVETDWLYRGLARFFPEAWQRFSAHVDHAEDLYAAYVARLEHADENVRIAAARAWCDWEDAALGFETTEHKCASLSRESQIALARTCARYAKNHAWLEDDQLIRDVARIAQIPAAIIHGRRDMTCPIETAYALARAWTRAELVVIEDAGHLASPSKRVALLDAFARFA